MQRGSDKHGPQQDDALEKDVHSMVQGDHPTRAEEALDAEPPADDDPKTRLRPDLEPEPGTETEPESDQP